MLIRDLKRISPFLLLAGVLLLLAAHLVRIPANSFSPRPANENDPTWSLKQARSLFEEDRAQSTRASIPFAQKAFDIWKTQGNVTGQLDSLLLMGEAQFRLGNFRTALQFEEQAIGIARDADMKARLAESLHRSSEAHLALSLTGIAAKESKEALALSRILKNNKMVALTLNQMGEVLTAYGRMQEAEKYYRESLASSTSINDRTGQAQSYLYLGYTFSDLGDPVQAYDYYQKALDIWQDLGDKRGLGASLSAIGKLYSRLGQREEAIKFFNQALPLIELTSNPIEEARTYNGMGYVYETLGEPGRAIEYYNRALQVYLSANYPRGVATTFHEIGRAYHLMSRYPEAYNYFNCFLSSSRTLEDQRRISYAYRGIGMTYDAMGDRDRALKFYRVALPLFQKGGDRRGEAFTLNLIGRSRQSKGEFRLAYQSYRHALELSRMAEDKIRESLTLYNLAELEYVRQNYAPALKYLESSIEIVESLRIEVNNLDLRASYLASVHSLYLLRVELLMELHGQHPRKGYDVLALQAGEQSRARSLIETLGSSTSRLQKADSSGLAEESEKLRRLIALKFERKSRLLLNPKSSKKEIDTLSLEIRALQEKERVIEIQLSEQTPTYAALTRPQPATLQEIQEMLDENTVLIEFALGPRRSYLWMVTSSTLRSRVIRKNRQEIQAAVSSIYDLISRQNKKSGETERKDDDAYWAKATDLSRALFGSLAGELRNQRLLIVPDGALQIIPFGALPKLAGKYRPAALLGNRKTAPWPMILDHEITNLPSASTLAVLRQDRKHRPQAPKSVAILADPVFEEDDIRFQDRRTETPARRTAETKSWRGTPSSDSTGEIPVFQRLYFTGEEAEAIRKMPNATDHLILTGFEANRAAIFNPDLAKYGTLHFATHGYLNSEHPEQSAIILSLYDRTHRRQDGFLYLHDIYNLNLNSDLVVLSACETALGKDIRGEGLIGLTRGFMYAGASRVMASLWKVSDRSTAELMKLFYQYHLTEELPPAAALQKAQLTMWQQPEWRSPYHWAGFVLQGEYK